jgi:hypothetical protein
MSDTSLSRRELLLTAASAAVAAGLPSSAGAQPGMPARPIPSTGEMLPVIGLGSSKVVSEIAARGTEPLAAGARSSSTAARSSTRGRGTRRTTPASGA